VDVMSNVDLVEAGKTAYRNYGRWKNDEVNDLITAATSAADEATKKEALGKLDDLYRQEVPAFPLMYRPDEFWEYNATNFVNWPDEDNDYAPPMFRGAGNEWLFQVQKYSS
jgi:peptide/nickel transport system substrate-binding protein